jgi:hypothetical protein
MYVNKYFKYYLHTLSMIAAAFDSSLNSAGAAQYLSNTSPPVAKSITKYSLLSSENTCGCK